MGKRNSPSAFNSLKRLLKSRDWDLKAEISNKRWNELARTIKANGWDKSAKAGRPKSLGTLIVERMTAAELYDLMRDEGSQLHSSDVLTEAGMAAGFIFRCACLGVDPPSCRSLAGFPHTPRRGTPSERSIQMALEKLVRHFSDYSDLDADSIFKTPGGQSLVPQPLTDEFFHKLSRGELISGPWTIAAVQDALCAFLRDKYRQNPRCLPGGPPGPGDLSRPWLKNLAERHDYEFVQAKMIDAEHLFNVLEVSLWFRHVEPILKGVSPAFIFNLDETSVSGRTLKRGGDSHVLQRVALFLR